MSTIDMRPRVGRPHKRTQPTPTETTQSPSVAEFTVDHAPPVLSRSESEDLPPHYDTIASEITPARTEAENIQDMQQTERELAEAMAANEVLARLREEQVALQQRVRVAEERARRMQVGYSLHE